MLIRKGKVKPYLPNITSKKKTQGKMEGTSQSQQKRISRTNKVIIIHRGSDCKFSSGIHEKRSALYMLCR